MTIYAPITTPYTYTVQTLWEKLLPRLDLSRQSVNFLNSCQEIIDLVTERLWFRHSDLLIDDVVYTIVDGTADVTVPGEFLAIADAPYVIDSDNKTTLLSNIHDSRRYDYIGETARPDFYYLHNYTVTVYPTSDDTYTLVIPCYVKPTELASMSDVIPFNGLFNQLIGDGAVKISNTGLSILGDPTFVATLHEKIDKTINLRNKKTILFRQTRSGNQSRSNYTGSNSPYFF